jgi:hypothetical protein
MALIKISTFFDDCWIKTLEDKNASHAGGRTGSGHNKIEVRIADEQAGLQCFVRVECVIDHFNAGLAFEIGNGIGRYIARSIEDPQSPLPNRFADGEAPVCCRNGQRHSGKNRQPYGDPLHSLLRHLKCVVYRS